MLWLIIDHKFRHTNFPEHSLGKKLRLRPTHFCSG
tara:strand:- start:132 stop:236 length:105 start_codon:yes stop_codon:yes gene_type:complete